MASQAQIEPKTHKLLYVSVICALVVTAFLLFKNWPDGHAGNIYIALHIALTVAMLIAWTSPRVDMRSLLILGVVLRIALIPVVPISSNDMERYLWDGAVTLSGLDPYTIAPDHPHARDLREIWATPPEHAQYPTLYPPAALSVFALSALSGPLFGVWLWKAIAALAGSVSLFVMSKVAVHYGQERHFALFALSPLLLLETGIGAHLDALLVLGLSLFLYFHAKERWGLLGLALGWSVCVKFLPLALLAPLFFAVPFRNFARLITSCFATVGTFYAGALALGYTPVGILPIFFEKWRFSSPFYQLIEHFCGPERMIFALAFFAVSGVIVACGIARKSALAGFAAVLSVPLFLSPVVFPWYLMILVPILAIRPNMTLVAWVSVVPLSYVVLNQWIAVRMWEPAQWPVYAIGLVLISCAAWDLGRVRLLSNRQGASLSAAIKAAGL